MIPKAPAPDDTTIRIPLVAIVGFGLFVVTAGLVGIRWAGNEGFVPEWVPFGDRLGHGVRWDEDWSAQQLSNSTSGVWIDCDDVARGVVPVEHLTSVFGPSVACYYDVEPGQRWSAFNPGVGVATFIHEEPPFGEFPAHETDIVDWRQIVSGIGMVESAAGRPVGVQWKKDSWGWWGPFDHVEWQHARATTGFESGGHPWTLRVIAGTPNPVAAVDLVDRILDGSGPPSWADP